MIRNISVHNKVAIKRQNAILRRRRKEIRREPSAVAIHSLCEKRRCGLVENLPRSLFLSAPNKNPLWDISLFFEDVLASKRPTG